MSSIARAGAHVASLEWERLDPRVARRVVLVVLDALGCGLAGVRLGAHHAFVRSLIAAGGQPDAGLWGREARLPAAHAALVNGTVAHHAEMDDGNPRASLHGGCSIVPAALAVGELTGTTGCELLLAIIAGYDVAVACGRPLLPGIGGHRLHPPSMTGCVGATAAAARLLGLDGGGVARALALATISMPFGPFEAFTKGAPVKDLYGGWPAFIGVTAACLAAEGLGGPVDVLEAQRDGTGTFLNHAAVHDAPEPDPAELLHVEFKTYATCRSVQPTLTALEGIDRLDAADVESIDVETYPFAVELSLESDAVTPIGAKTSIPYGVASFLLDREVFPDAFTQAALIEPERRALAKRVRVAIAADMVDPVVRGSRVTVHLRDGTNRRGSADAARWTSAAPARADELRTKFRRLAGGAAPEIERAVDGLAAAADLGALSQALQREP